MAGEVEIERMVVRLVGDMSQYRRVIKDAIDLTEQSAKQIANSVGKIGRSMSLALTAPLVGLGALAIKAGSDFESGFAGVRKTVTASEAEFAMLRQGFKDMATEVPIAVEELLKIGEISGQLGIANSNILGFTKTIAKLGVATNLTTEQGTADLARLANITGMSQTKFENLGSAIVALGNNFPTTEAEIVALSLRLAGAGKTVGLTIPQITGMATAISSVGIEAEMGGTAFSRLMLEIATASATGSETMEEFARVAGKSVAEFQMQFETNAAGAVESLLRGMSRLDMSDKVRALEAMGIEGTRLTDAILRTSGAIDKFSEAMQLSETAFNENKALSKEAAERFKTFASQVTLLHNNFKGLLEETFLAVQPALQTIVDATGDVITYFRQLSPEAKRVAVVIGTIVAVTGPFLIAIAGAARVVAFAASGLGILGSGIRKLGYIGTVVQWLVQLRNAFNALPFAHTRAEIASTAAAQKLLGVTSATTSAQAQTSFARIGTASTGMAVSVKSSVAASNAAITSLQTRLIGLQQTALTVRNSFVVMNPAIANIAGPTLRTAQAADVIDAEWTAVNKSLTNTTRLSIGYIGTANQVTSTLGRVSSAVSTATSWVGSKFSGAIRGATSLLGSMKFELVLVTAYIGFKLGQALSDSVGFFKNWTGSIKEANEALARMAELQGKSVKRQDVAFQLKMTQVGGLDAGAQKAALTDMLQQAQVEAQGYAREIKRSQADVDSLNTTWRSFTGNKLLAAAQQELAGFKSKGMATEEQINQLKQALAGLAVAESTVASGTNLADKAAEAMSTHAKQLADDLDSLTQRLDLQNKTFGLSARAAEIEELRLRGLSEADLARVNTISALIDAQEKQLAASEKQKEIDDAAQEFVASLQTQMATLEMTSREAEIYRMQMEGASAVQLMFARDLDKQLTAMEKQKSMMEKGKELTKQFLSPMEQFAAAQTELEDLVIAGAISMETYNAGLMEAAKSAGMLSGALGGVQAAQAGTADAMQRISDFQEGRRLPPQLSGAMLGKTTMQGTEQKPTSGGKDAKSMDRVEKYLAKMAELAEKEEERQRNAVNFELAGAGF